jgi:hypothetical protein
VKWTTASEINCLKYEIEEGTGTGKFNVVASEAARGSSSSITSYSVIIDASRASETKYYRVKGIDLDGVLTYSPLVSSQQNSPQRIQLSPNPVAPAEDLIFEPGFSFQGIYDAMGKLVCLTPTAPLTPGLQYSLKLTPSVRSKLTPCFRA